MVSDTELKECIRKFLSTSDLEAETIRSMRRKLEEDLGIDLSDRKAFIREQIDLYSRSQTQENDNKMESSNGKISWSLSDGNRKQYKAFDCGAPGSSNGHINDVGLSESMPFAVIMTDQDVFHCPVCFEKLTNNVYQCENGHIACHSCRLKINKICPTCLCLIEYRCLGLEKVLEAVQVPCVNAEHGCQQVISYSKIRDHEDLCTYLPCSCPIQKCDFKGADSNLYQHFDENHKEKAVIFQFKFSVSVSITREKNHIVLREKASGTLFVVKLFSVPQGKKVISVVLIGPKRYSGKYRSELTAKDDGVMPPVAMHLLVESVPRLADYPPTRYFLEVEDGIPQLNLDVRILPKE